MKISIVKNCVRRVQTVSTNVKVANRVNASGKKEQVEIYDSISMPGFTVHADSGTVYGRRGRAVGFRTPDGRFRVHTTIDGVHKSFLRARIVAEAVLGRKLTSDEEVDHINNIVSDDRICNLQVVDHRSNMNNPLTKALRDSKTRKFHSERIELIGEKSSRPKRTYTVETAR